MKKLALTAVGVAIVLVGFMAILYCLPCNHECSSDRDQCEMKGGDGKCMDGHGGKEERTERVWTDAEGKVHREVHVEMHGGGEGSCKGDEPKCPMMEGGCKMEGMQHEGCEMGKMQQEGCQMGGGMQMGCCCCMMKCGGMNMDMNSCKGDSGSCKMKMDTTKTKLKVRGKL